MEVCYEVFFTEKTIIVGRTILVGTKRKRGTDNVLDIQWGSYLEDANRKLEFSLLGGN